MANTLAIKGASARLTWGYHLAATLSGWAVGGAPGAWTFTATIVSSDAFRLSQRPLRVGVTGQPWSWDILELQIAGASLTATIAAKE